MWSFEPIYPSQIDEKAPDKRVNQYFSHRFTILEPIWEILIPNYRFLCMPESCNTLTEISDEVLTPFVHVRLQNCPCHHSASPNFHLGVISLISVRHLCFWVFLNLGEFRLVLFIFWWNTSWHGGVTLGHMTWVSLVCSPSKIALHLEAEISPY